MGANIQNLLQQLSANSQNTPTDSTSATSATSSLTSTTTDPLSMLNSSFQNLVTAMNSSKVQNPASSPTLQSFLQNLMQNMGNGQNISGAFVSTKA
jgi:hypothetical protein